MSDLPTSGPLRHIVCLTWKPGTQDATVAAVCEALGALPAVIPQIHAYRFGSDLGLADGNADFAIVGDFADVAAWHRYQEHPEHQRVLAELIGPNLAARTAAQFAL
jgi:hypothetical protein